MSLVVNPDDLAQLRSQLSDKVESIHALDVIEDCEGDLEDAAITLAIQVGQEPDTNERWIDGFAKRYRALICTSSLQEDLRQGSISSSVTAIATLTNLPITLATLVVVYVLHVGIEDFCQPLVSLVES